MPTTDDNQTPAPVAGITPAQLAALATKVSEGDVAMEARVTGVIDSVATNTETLSEIKDSLAALVAAQNEGPAVRSTQVDLGTVPKADDAVVDDGVVKPAGDSDEDHLVAAALRQSWKAIDQGAVAVSGRDLTASLRSLVIAGNAIGHFVEPTKRGR